MRSATFPIGHHLSIHADEPGILGDHVLTGEAAGVLWNHYRFGRDLSDGSHSDGERMRLTAKSEYGVLAMIDLACNHGEGPVSAREVAERRNIPPRFLEQLFVALRRAGLVNAVRGARGGFALSDEPSKITVLQVVEALEGPLTASVCETDRGNDCGQSGACAAAPVWMRATRALRDVFDSTTLAELAGTQQRFDERASART